MLILIRGVMAVTIVMTVAVGLAVAVLMAVSIVCFMRSCAAAIRLMMMTVAIAQFLFLVRRWCNIFMLAVRGRARG